ncbi:MAG: hypothetical protein J6U60_01015 [Clostridia bacterium]|nr:hypothetical protein [Clostridia bacterium]
MSQWICFPDDYEIMLYNKNNDMRYERDVRVFSLTKRAAISVAVSFYKEFTLTKTNKIKILYDGDINVRVEGGQCDGQYVYNFNGELVLPAGKYRIYISAYCNDGRIPTIYVEGDELKSDGSWLCNDGVNIYVPVGCTGLTNPDISPNSYALPTRLINAQMRKEQGKNLYDCQKELMAFLRFDGVKGHGEICVFYGESPEEALDKENCETLDFLSVKGEGEIETKIAKGFRYFTVETQGDVTFSGVTVLEEYKPQERVCKFTCENEDLNRIWDISLHTMNLTTRLFFLDGIKRDRWVWGGDAYQSVLMNRFSFMDIETAKRTLTAILGLGKSGFLQHINNINSYSFFVLIMLKEFFDQTADVAYVEHVYPRAKKLMEFCVSRLNEKGFMVGYPEDWGFVDWSDGVTGKGALSYNQILLCVALRAMSVLAFRIQNPVDGERYACLAESIYQKIQDTFWCEELGGFAYSLDNGELDCKMMKQPNAMAVIFDIATAEQKQKILKNVLLNDSVLKIKTPYMMFYELAAMAKLGEKKLVYEKMLEYWGGMLKEDVTSFWEVYDPNEHGAEKYAMYGRKYGKSLCHAWGATPLYIVGGYLVGLQVSEGKHLLRLDGVEWIERFEIKVPVLTGWVEIAKTGQTYKIRSTGDSLRVRLDEKLNLEKLTLNGKTLNVGLDRELLLQENQEYVIGL